MDNRIQLSDRMVVVSQKNQFEIEEDDMFRVIEKYAKRLNELYREKFVNKKDFSVKEFLFKSAISLSDTFGGEVSDFMLAIRTKAREINNKNKNKYQDTLTKETNKKNKNIHQETLF